MFTILWKYKVKPEYRHVFEQEYGPDGTWAKLFSESEGYQGSYLQRSEEEPSTYLLLDTWADKAAYLGFLQRQEKHYREQSTAFEYLYELEELLGTYTSVD